MLEKYLKNEVRTSYTKCSFYLSTLDQKMKKKSDDKWKKKRSN